MEHSDIKHLIEVGNKSIAEEIKRILEEHNIYCLLTSDNAASSFLHAYFGVAANDSFSVKVNIEDYEESYALLETNSYVASNV